MKKYRMKKYRMKSYKMKKAFASIITAVLALAMFSGCSNESNGNTTSDNLTKSSEATDSLSLDNKIGDDASSNKSNESNESNNKAEDGEDETNESNKIEVGETNESNKMKEYKGESETTLTVFAAASMTETLTEIAELYKKKDPNVELIFNFDSSGTLKTQIEEGAVCDIFISAAQKQMNALDASKDKEGGNEKGLDFVLKGTRIDLLENKVALSVPEGNPSNIKSYDDLAKRLKKGNILLAMGNSDVPVGQYTEKILSYYELDEAKLSENGCITYGSNVKEVTTQVSEGAVDCGIIYATDAFSAGLPIIDTATPEMCGQVIYPAAVLNITEHEEEAKAFLDYLTGSEASKVFEAVGFSPLS